MRLCAGVFVRAVGGAVGTLTKAFEPVPQTRSAPTATTPQMAAVREICHSPSLTSRSPVHLRIAPSSPPVKIASFVSVPACEIVRTGPLCASNEAKQTPPRQMKTAPVSPPVKATSLETYATQAWLASCFTLPPRRPASASSGWPLAKLQNETWPSPTVAKRSDDGAQPTARSWPRRTTAARASATSSPLRSAKTATIACFSGAAPTAMT
mmetsp:Transcript_9801/g.32291  ORF Transcript_9801/g.32291 Transcript_9801/m.32291 type:complete len:210 (+) Transcript_9801:951-1580(+)